MVLAKRPCVSNSFPGTPLPAQLRVALLLTPILSNTVTQQLDHPPSQALPIEDPGIIVEKAEVPAPNSIEPETPVDSGELKAVE